MNEPESLIEELYDDQLHELHAVLVEGVDECRKEIKNRQVQWQLEDTLATWMMENGLPDVPPAGSGEVLYLRFVASYQGDMDETEEFICTAAVFKKVMSAQWPAIAWAAAPPTI
ncbi:hypothetical protein B484DRAFT_401365 [Ochromonadaceae sp. CCMP2298]|nr:hypothetical protein B484DRAFT_401365 [Ochromonadaceae sp. CCMP2298]